MIEGLNLTWQTELSSHWVPWTAPRFIIKSGSLFLSAGPRLTLQLMCFCWQIEVHYWPLFTHTHTHRNGAAAESQDCVVLHDCSFDGITAAVGRFSFSHPNPKTQIFVIASDASVHTQTRRFQISTLICLPLPWGINILQSVKGCLVRCSVWSPTAVDVSYLSLSVRLTQWRHVYS